MTLSPNQIVLALTVVSSLYVGTDSTHAVCSVQGQKEYCLVHCCNVHLGRPRVCPSMCTLPSVILPTAFIDLAAFLSPGFHHEAALPKQKWLKGSSDS